MITSLYCKYMKLIIIMQYIIVRINEKDDTPYCEVPLEVFAYYVFMRVWQCTFR